MEERKDNWQDMHISKLSTVARLKGEVYRLLTYQGKLYFPPKSYANADFVSDVLSGYKKNDNVRKIFVPFGKDLLVERILEFACKHCIIDEYMPDIKDGQTPPREFVGNIVNTLIPDRFKEFIDSRLKERENLHSAKKKMNLKILPKFKGLFETSYSTPRYGGKFCSLIKGAKIRRANREEDSSINQRIESMEREAAKKDKAIAELNF